MTNKHFLNSIQRNMVFLNRFGEYNLFISQNVMAEGDLATVMLSLPSHRDEQYLALRRLLKAFKYRLEKEGDYSFDFELKRKGKG